MKQFVKWVVSGMAVTLGGIIMNSVASTCQDPVKRSKAKRKFDSFMNIFKEDWGFDLFLLIFRENYTLYNETKQKERMIIYE